MVKKYAIRGIFDNGVNKWHKSGRKWLATDNLEGAKLYQYEGMGKSILESVKDNEADYGRDKPDKFKLIEIEISIGKEVEI